MKIGVINIRGYEFESYSLKIKVSLLLVVTLLHFGSKSDTKV